MRDFHPALEHHLLDVAKTEAKVEPNEVGDDLA